MIVVPPLCSFQKIGPKKWNMLCQVLMCTHVHYCSRKSGLRHRGTPFSRDVPYIFTDASEVATGCAYDFLSGS